MSLLDRQFKSATRYLLAIGALLLAAGCSTIQSGSHYDETFDFRSWETWSWIADDPHVGGGGTEIDDPLAHAKIRDAISEQLHLKGYRFVDDRDSADFVISYSLGSRDKLRVSSYPVAYRGPWGWHVVGSRYYVNEYEEHVYTEGTLAVDAFDGETRQPVWHGWASKSVTRQDRANPDQAIKTGVARVFEPFPRREDRSGIDSGS